MQEFWLLGLDYIHVLYYDGCDCYDFISDLFLSPTRGDQLHMSYQLLYHIMTLLKSCADKAFELVIDLTQATQYNEPDVSVRVSQYAMFAWPPPFDNSP